jgi:serine/threonine protein kinase
VGRFRVSPDEVLRRRPWGTVRGAEDERGQPVVSKSTRARHDREHEALRALEGHPRVPRVVGREHMGDSDWLFLERRPGQALGERNRCRPRSEGAALRIADQVLDVCERLHAGGLVHTDLQPANVLDAGGEVTVLDFEHAVRLDERGLWSGELNWGVWEFVPPEQLADFTTLDASADVYSVAVLLAYLIRGEVPFRFRVMETYRAGGWEAVRRRFLELRSAPQLDRLGNRVRAEIERVLLAPFGRRPTASGFRLALQEVARGA